VDNIYFAVYICDILGDLNLYNPHAYCLVTIIDGTGTLSVNDKHYDIPKGSGVILTTEDEDIHLVGNSSAIVSHPGY
ncbi:mannose-6-phosphate isomerase, class I, partial [Staphylococcus aureus]|nr:mannose-6-phosphate isomerase, class I [Staphylococcus aureus]